MLQLCAVVGAAAAENRGDVDVCSRHCLRPAVLVDDRSLPDFSHAAGHLLQEVQR